MTTSSSVEMESKLAARARSGGMRPITCDLILNGSLAEASSAEDVQRLIAGDALAAVWDSAESASTSVSIPFSFNTCFSTLKEVFINLLTLGS